MGNPIVNIMSDFDDLREAIDSGDVFKPASEEELSQRELRPTHIRIVKDIYRDQDSGELDDVAPEVFIPKGTELKWNEEDEFWDSDTLGYDVYAGEIADHPDWYTSLDPVAEAVSPEMFKPINTSELSDREDELFKDFKAFWNQLISVFGEIQDPKKHLDAVESLVGSYVDGFPPENAIAQWEDFRAHVDKQLSGFNPGKDWKLSELKILSIILNGPLTISGVEQQ